jgi:GT2 family glycosyltransferase
MIADGQPSDPAPRISVIIVTLGRPDLLGETLDSLAACQPLPDELIVVDGDPQAEPGAGGARP